MSDTARGAIILTAAAICIFFPYLLGSMNFAIIISKKRYKADIRSFGSGNAGATNMMRTFGKTAAYLTFLGDALKAFVAGMIGYAAWGQYGVYIAGLFCILGHMFPLYYKFKGGKGVVTAAISILMCNPIVFLILVAIFLLIAVGTKYISLASVMCMLLYPLVLDRVEKLMGGHAGAYLVIAIANALLVVFMHRENIKRLLAGKESKFSFKKSVKPEGAPLPEEKPKNED
ncbi:MAG: glycerol-3-phosphate 1-O-acyltransferase PlsY [Ruminococcaceae bacterium]|nr:glycerol-3-phosphate 1-O-acyltransferase PlsY [Oscillospiraceae bacterium]